MQCNSKKLMKTKEILKELGFSPTDRVVIFHADDIGMCEASVSAYAELLDFGLMSSAATMVPCPWFPLTAKICRENEEKVDIGVHLTLTSEWDGYRWSPITTDDPESGLVDDEGYFPRAAHPVQEKSTSEIVYKELKAQIERALSAGINVTHLDTHMFSIYPAFVDVYLRLADEYKLPIFALQPNSKMKFPQALTESQAEKYPLLNAWCVMSYEDETHRFEQAKALLENLEAGITYFLLHPSKDTPELRAIAPDWRTRVADYHLFTDKKFRAYIRERGIQIIGWRALKNLL